MCVFQPENEHLQAWLNVENKRQEPLIIFNYSNSFALVLHCQHRLNLKKNIWSLFTELVVFSESLKCLFLLTSLKEMLYLWSTFYAYLEFFCLFITSNRISDSLFPATDPAALSQPMAAIMFVFVFSVFVGEWKKSQAGKKVTQFKLVQMQGLPLMKQHFSLKVSCCNEWADFTLGTALVLVQDKVR